jgi:hypothetical protein
MRVLLAEEMNAPAELVFRVMADLRNAVHWGHDAN